MASNDCVKPLNDSFDTRPTYRITVKQEKDGSYNIKQIYTDSFQSVACTGKIRPKKRLQFLPYSTYVEDKRKIDKSYVDVVNSVENRINSQVVAADFIVESVNKQRTA